jgi:hypothetical protein
MDGDAVVGEGTKAYGYGSGTGTLTRWNALYHYTVTKCTAGYYAHNATCEKTTIGYFSPDNDIEQHKCPYGATTSGVGAKSVTDCYFDKIKDSSGHTYTTGVNAYLSTTLICKYCKEDKNLCGDVECPESTN